MKSNSQSLEKIGRLLYRIIGEPREVEYKHALEYFKACGSVVDVGCGTGGFLKMLCDDGKSDVVGVDYNHDCVDICTQKGLHAVFGNALDIPFENDRFDGAYCSHVIHIFDSSDAVKLIKELSRVVKPNGIIAIATVPMHPGFFSEPADNRPYPPKALRGLFQKPGMEGHGAPTITGLPILTEEAIWLRRPPLSYFNFQDTHTSWLISQAINDIQCFLYLRKYWAFNGYIIKLRNGKQPG